MRRIVLGLAIMLFLAGCSTLRTIAEKYEAPEKVAKAIKSYCKEVSYDERVKNRAAVNEAAAPNSIAVYCDGDPE